LGENRKIETFLGENRKIETFFEEKFRKNRKKIEKKEKIERKCHH
jgi:hypothetical protein